MIDLLPLKLFKLGAPCPGGEHGSYETLTGKKLCWLKSGQLQSLYNSGKAPVNQRSPPYRDSKSYFSLILISFLFNPIWLMRGGGVNLTPLIVFLQ